jgi:hypothetical protein
LWQLRTVALSIITRDSLIGAGVMVSATLFLTIMGIAAGCNG